MVMETSKRHRRQPDEMALVLVENKRLQSLVNDLDASVTRACHQEEHLEIKVLALLKEHEMLEVETRTLIEQLSHRTDH